MKINVLVVSENEQTRLDVARIFELGGHQVLNARTINQARGSMIQNMDSLDAIIIDMDVMSEFDIESAMNTARSARIIMLSSANPAEGSLSDPLCQIIRFSKKSELATLEKFLVARKHEGHPVIAVAA